MFLHSLLMQEPKRPPKRKRWYGRVMEVIILWKSFIKSSSSPSPSPPPPAAAAKLDSPIPGSSGKAQKLRKCASLKVASSFTRVCLCAPISSYNSEVVFRATDAPPRRSYSYPRSKSFLTAPAPALPPDKTTVVMMRSSVEGRRVFRGKSLTDDILMRRFVVAEETMLRQLRRRNQMEFIRRRNAGRRRKIGPSPLSRMATAEEEEEEEEQALQ